MTESRNTPLQRLRLTYRHGPELRYISNLDLIRLFERALRRARLPIAYSQGFNAHPRLKVAAPLPVGFAGDCEMVDFLLTEGIEPAAFSRRLGRQLPTGITPCDIIEVDRRSPPLASLLRAAHYRADHGPWDPQQLAQAVNRLLAADHLIRTRLGKGRRPREYDLRPLILDLRAAKKEDAPSLQMTLSAREGATGRPEEVLLALGLDPLRADITRAGMVFEDC